MWPYHECVVDVSEPFSGFVVSCVQCYFLEVLREYVTDHRRQGFPLPYPLFTYRKLSWNWKCVVVKQISSSYITPSTCKGERSGEEGSVLSLFLMTCKTSHTGTLVKCDNDKTYKVVSVLKVDILYWFCKLFWVPYEGACIARQRTQDLVEDFC
jgi:hypothetical protein